MPDNINSSGLLGHAIRSKLYQGEDDYFRANPHVTGMAAQTGHIILNPYSAPGINRQAVARNEALRLEMMNRDVRPQFPVTDQQRTYFVGTPYQNDDNAMRQTILARIYSGDPTANATPDQSSFLSQLLNSWGSR